jgi:hypothetical protein
VRDADNERLAFLTTQMRAAGLTGAEARSRAAFVYAALIGMEQLAGEPALTPSNMAGIIDAALTARRLTRRQTHEIPAFKRFHPNPPKDDRL